VPDPGLAEAVAAAIRDVPDFPSPGILFKDISPLLADPALFRRAVEAIAGSWGPVEAVVGIEARGFILGVPVAQVLQAAFVPVRKAGKLPAATVEVDYALEYGTARIAVHADAFEPGARVLVVDDVLATGGTAAAAVDLVRRAGGEPVGFSALLEIAALGGRQALGALPVRALLEV
jgi:adenine phosphoribosyltransferase